MTEMEGGCTYWANGALWTPPSKRAGRTVYVALARELMLRVAAPTVPASPEVANGSVRRQHWSAELPLLSVTMAVASRNFWDCLCVLAEYTIREVDVATLDVELSALAQR